MTALELFETVKNHLLKQNKRSTKNDTFCLYKNPEGLKCAIGVLIKDEFYKKGFEGFQLVGDKKIQKAVELSIQRNLLEAEIRMLDELQFLHDNVDEEDWAEGLKEIYDKYQENLK